MSDVIKKATRESYGEALVAMAEKYPNLVVLDADLAGARGMQRPQSFRRPERRAMS